jgi:pyruvate kinase
LAIANLTAVSLNAGNLVLDLDFTNVLTLTTGDTATVVGNQCMLAGDVNSDNTIDLIDLGLLNTQVDSILPSAVDGTALNGYFLTDTNFDGIIIKDEIPLADPDHLLINPNVGNITVVHPIPPAPP